MIVGTELSASQYAVLAITAAGVLFGIRSVWRDYHRDRMAIRIVPTIAYPIGPADDPRPRLAFEIVNDSTFPVTIDEVGFLYRGTKTRRAITAPLLPNGESWPHSLEPFASVTVYATPEHLLDPSLRRARCAYVRTANARLFRGLSPALRDLIATGVVPALPSRAAE
jgi:hypothetical protein